MSHKRMLARWQQAGLIDPATADRIRAFESTRRPQVSTALAFGLVGGFALIVGIAAMVAANWASIPAWVKLSAHGGINALAVATLGWMLAAGRSKWGREVALLLTAGLTLTFLALITQLYQSHGPVWGLLTLWWLLVTPMLLALARTRLTLALWWVALIGLLPHWLDALHELFETRFGWDAIGLSIFLVGCLAPGSLAVAQRAHRAAVSDTARLVGGGLVLALINGAQFLWYQDDQSLLLGQALWPTCALLAMAGWMMWRSLPPNRDDNRRVWQGFAAIAVLSLLPILVPHGGWPVAQALGFIAVWTVLGLIAASRDQRWLATLAMVMILLRIIIVYFEVFGSLTSTGIGLVIVGSIVMAGAYGIQRMHRRLARAAG